MGVTDKTIADSLMGKHPPERKLHFSTLQVYDETPIFIPVNIMEDVVEFAAQKTSGRAGPSENDSEALQGWLLKIGDDIKKLCIGVENFMEWLANQIPPWAAYWSFMSGCQITLY